MSFKKEERVPQVRLADLDPQWCYSAVTDEDEVLKDIKENGMKEPVDACWHEGKLMLVHRGRRYYSAQRLGWKTIPCRVYGDVPGKL